MIQLLNIVYSESGTCLHKATDSAWFQQYADDTRSTRMGDCTPEDFYAYMYKWKWENKPNAPTFEDFKVQEGEALLKTSKVLGFVCRVKNEAVPIIDSALPLKTKAGKYIKEDLYKAYYTPKISNSPLLWAMINETKDVFLTPAEFVLLTMKPPYNLRVPVAKEVLLENKKALELHATVVVKTAVLKHAALTHYLDAYLTGIPVVYIKPNVLYTHASSLSKANPAVHTQLISKTKRFIEAYPCKKKGV